MYNLSMYNLFDNLNNLQISIVNLQSLLRQATDVSGLPQFLMFT